MNSRTDGAAGHLSSNGGDVKLSQQWFEAAGSQRADGDSKENYHNRDQEEDVRSKLAAPLGQQMLRPASSSQRDHQLDAPAKQSQGRAVSKDDPLDTMGQFGAKSARQPSVKSPGACLGKQQQPATESTSTSSMPSTLTTTGGHVQAVQVEETIGDNNGSPFGRPATGQPQSQSSGTSIVDTQVTAAATAQQPRYKSQDQLRCQVEERFDDVESPIRSQSAMVGCLAGSSNGTTKRDGRANRVPRSKPMRVRINSTSEQIEDPNWLIRMSQELEQRQQGGAKRSHLRALQRKLKSTITGHHYSSSTMLEQTSNAALPTESLETSSSISATPPVISIPVKVPVSILKRAGASNGSSSPASLSNQNPPAPRKPPVFSAKSVTAQSETGANKITLDSPTRQSRPSSRSSSRTGQSKQTADVGGKSTKIISEPEKAISSSLRKLPASPTNRPVSLCADGQVKVSGWKRKNLLAKTLSHFDEIRGNQRPVFMPTKIRLPAAELESRGPNKFADVVRQAIIRKNLLQETDKDSTGTEQVKFEQPKRSSNGELKDTKEGLSKETVRPLSADGFVSHAHRSQQQQKRPSSTVPGDQGLSGNSQPEAAQANKQQVIVSLNKKTGSSVMAGSASPVGHTSALASSSLVSQFLSATEPSSSSSTPRQFKLQLKNQQVLQNLRRQSNEFQASLQHDNQQILDGPSPQQQTGAGKNSHLKDWKRLTGKLALLTGSKSRAYGTQLTEPQSLRLTVSNEESSSGGKNQTRLLSQLGAGTLLVPSDPTQLGLEPSRKLSSSSMIVQSAGNSKGRDTTIGSRSALNSPLLSITDQLNHRRSSDTEAQKKSVVSSHIDNASDNIRKPVVVNKTDLLHLIQVTGVAGTVNTPGDCQLNSDNNNLDSSSTTTKEPIDSAQTSEATNVGLSQLKHNSEHNDDESDEPEDGETEKPSKSSPLCRQATDKADSSERTDLSRVVRKTSKVAFFQQKLRKMRWHTKQQRTAFKAAQMENCENKLDPDVLAGDDAQKRQMSPITDTNKPTTTSTTNGDHPASPISSDVFMDPTLIGDAIEIFLRSTMQDEREGKESPEEQSLSSALDHQGGSSRPSADTIKLH